MSSDNPAFGAAGRLERLSEKATQGEWAHGMATYIQTFGPDAVAIADFVGRMERWPDNRAFICALVNAYRSGDLVLRSELARVEGELARERAAHSNTLDRRDVAEDYADKLAEAIAGEPMSQESIIGEYSNINNPWARALDIAEDRVALSPATAPSATGGSGTGMREALVAVQAFVNANADKDDGQNALTHWIGPQNWIHITFGQLRALATSEPAQDGEDALARLRAFAEADDYIKSRPDGYEITARNRAPIRIGDIRTAIAALRDRPAASADTLAALKAAEEPLRKAAVSHDSRGTEAELPAGPHEAALTQAEATSTVTPDRELDGKGEQEALVQDAKRWRYMQQKGYFSTGPVGSYGEWVGYSVGVQFSREPLNHCTKGWGQTLEEAIDAALAHSTSTGGENAR